MPGVYKVVGSWTADVDSYANWEGSISLEAGKRSNLSISLEGGVPAIVSITSSAATIWKGGTTTYSATSNKGAVTWSSSNTSVATVNPSTGVVTSVSYGSANIIATAGDVSDSIPVYVNELTGISISPV